MKEQKIYFSKPSFGDASETLVAWTGGGSYIHLFAIHIFGIKIEFWKKN